MGDTPRKPRELARARHLVHALVGEARLFGETLALLYIPTLIAIHNFITKAPPPGFIRARNPVIRTADRYATPTILLTYFCLLPWISHFIH